MFLVVYEVLVSFKSKKSVYIKGGIVFIGKKKHAKSKIGYI